jgi:hypothetical protein
MDPNAVLREIDAYLGHRPTWILTDQELDERVEDLARWLDRGGFEPDWNQYAIGASYYRTRTLPKYRQEMLLKYPNRDAPPNG